MASIKDLRNKAAALKKRAKDLEDEIENDLMDDEVDQKDIDEKESEYDELKNRLERLEASILKREDEEEEKAEDDMSCKEESEEKMFTPNIVKGQIGSGHDPKYGIGRKAVLAALTRVKGHHEAKKIFSNSFGVKEYEAKVKDLSSTSQPLVAPEYHGFIDLVRARTIIRNISNHIDMSTNGNVTIPRAIAGSTASWVGEGAIIPSSAPNFDTINMLWKKIAVTSSMTKELALFGAFDVARYVSEDLAKQLAIGEDYSLINNTARTETSPNGLLGYTTASGNSATVTGNDFATINSALYQALSFIAGKNFMTNDLVWIMPVQTELFLRSIATTLGIYPFANEMDRTGKLFGAKVYTTNLIATNGGTSTNQSSIYLVDPTYLQFATASNLESMVTDVGSLSDSNGSVTANAFAQDLTLFRVTERLDFQLTLDNAAFRLDVTDWTLSPQGAMYFNPQSPNYAGSSASGAIGKIKPAAAGGTSSGSGSSTSGSSTTGSSSSGG